MRHQKGAGGRNLGLEKPFDRKYLKNRKSQRYMSTKTKHLLEGNCLKYMEWGSIPSGAPHKAKYVLHF